MTNPRILIVEDEELILKGLSDVFVFNGYEVDTASEGTEGLKKALGGGHHLILLDIMLPGLDGLTICNRIREKDRAQPVIMLTAKGDEDDIIRGLKLGADDYVTKPFSVRELLARVEAVLRRSSRALHDAAQVNFGAFEIDPPNLSGRVAGRPVELTRREVDILCYLIRNETRPVTRQELLREVWGYNNPQMDTRTVDIHMAKLRKKIEDDPAQPKRLVTIRGEGYRLVKET